MGDQDLSPTPNQAALRDHDRASTPDNTVGDLTHTHST